MPILKEREREQVQKQFEGLVNPVKLVMFTQKIECEYCEETRMMVEEVAALSDKVTAEIYNFITDKEVAEKYGVDKIPAIAILGVHPQGSSPEEKDYGIRYYGIPAGYEFSALIEDIKTVSSGQSGLLEETKVTLAQIDEPVHMQVFTTPTCPYCPRAVVLTHKMALESEHIRADGIEAMEFPHLAIKYQVQGVPRTVINETMFIEGAVPEPIMVEGVLKALGKDNILPHQGREV